MMHQFLLMVFWHFLADFPLQGDFLAKNKDPGTGFGYQPIWPWCMSAHCAIQAGGVYVITGSWILAVGEFICHWGTDYVKCRGKITFGQDQFIHIAQKLVWSAVS